MARLNKTTNNLQSVWNDLDLAYEYMEKAIDKMCSMSGLPIELRNQVDRFDISAISALKEHIEIVMEEK